MTAPPGLARCASALASLLSGRRPSTRLPDRPAVTRPWRPLIIALLCTLVVAGLGYVLYHQQMVHARDRAAVHLENSALLTARQVELWVADRRASIEHAAANPALARAVRGTLAGDAGAGLDLQAALDFIAHSHEFTGMEVVKGGGQVVATVGEPIAMTAGLAQYLKRARITGRVVMTDVYAPEHASPGQAPVVDFVAAIDVESEDPAMLVARIDPTRFLYPALKTAQPGTAMPVYGLVRRTPRGASILTTADEPGREARLQHLDVGHSPLSAQVIGGRRGVFEARDYQGEDTLAIGLPVDGTPWFLVAKVPAADVHGPVTRSARAALLLVATGIACVVVLAALWRRNERFALLRRALAAELRTKVLGEHFAVAGRLVNDLVLLLDAQDRRILEANDRAVEAYGFTREELLQLHWQDLAADGGVGTVAADDRAKVLRRGRGAFVVWHRRKDGTTLPLEVSARTLTIGGHTYIQKVGRDITERLEREAQIAAVSAERDRLLERMQLQFERMGSACVVLATDGRVLQVNAAFEQTFGYLRHNVVGRGLGEFVVLQGFRQAAAMLVDELRARPDWSYSGVHDNVTAEGSPLVCRWTASALRSPDGAVHGIIAMADDITELVRAERALRSSEARYRALAEASTVGIFRADPAGNLVFVNPRFMAITGYDRQQATEHEWTHAVHRDDVVLVAEAWATYLKERGMGARRSLEFRVRRPDGRTAWVLTQLHPEHDGEGALVGHIGTITDVTTLKLAQLELQQSNERLEQRVRERTHELEAAKSVAEQSDRVKTAFLSSMSHELRTPLNAILGFTDVLLGAHAGPLNEEQARQLGMVRKSAARLRAMVEEVLDVSRIVAGQVDMHVGTTDLRAILVGQIEEFADEAARKGLRIELQAPDATSPIRTDGRRVAQVVRALLSNAVKFTDAGQVSVGLRVEPDRIEVDVVDTGVGIPAEALDRLFDPFAQVARPGGRLRDGTGLGLAIARHMAQALGGDVLARSQLGQGSRFTFWLPVREALAA